MDTGDEICFAWLCALVGSLYRLGHKLMVG
jgi:hypothetical protein